MNKIREKIQKKSQKYHPKYKHFGNLWALLTHQHQLQLLEFYTMKKYWKISNTILIGILLVCLLVYSGLLQLSFFKYLPLIKIVLILFIISYL